MRIITPILNTAPGYGEDLIHNKIKPASDLSNLSLHWPSIQREALDSADPQIMAGNLNRIATSTNTTQSCRRFVIIWYEKCSSCLQKY